MCSNLKEVTLSNEITSLPNGCFNNCINLTGITIPSTVTVINENAFRSTNISEINIPSTVTDIGNSAFQGCVNLTGITIPNGVKYLSQGLLTDCKGLTEVNLPSSIKEIKGDDIFRNNNSLRIINFSGTKAEWLAIKKPTRNNYNANAKIVCTDGEFPMGLTLNP